MFTEPRLCSCRLEQKNVQPLNIPVVQDVLEVQVINHIGVFNVFKTNAKRIRNIEYQIASKKQMVKQGREDQILRFKEAILIANLLGIKRRSDATNLFKNSQMNLDIITATNPIYFIGTESLKAEIRILENRVTDDPFIDGLRDVQEQLARLRFIKIEEEKLHAVNVDKAAFPAKEWIRSPLADLLSLLVRLLACFQESSSPFLLDCAEPKEKAFLLIRNFREKFPSIFCINYPEVKSMIFPKKLYE